MPTPVPAVKALVERNDEYLLLDQRTDDGHLWTLPGGKVEFGEPPRQALRREVDEEVGLAIDVGTPVDVYDFQFGRTHVVATVFRCRTRSDDRAVDITSNPADEAIEGYEWASRGDGLTARPMNDGLATVLDSLRGRG